YRLRLDVDQLRRFWLGDLSLWAMGLSGRLRLGLVSGKRSGMGTCLGFVAIRRRLLWLGAAAAAGSWDRLRGRTDRAASRYPVRYRATVLQFHRYSLLWRTGFAGSYFSACAKCHLRRKDRKRDQHHCEKQCRL